MKKALLVVSFGTSSPLSREKGIGAIEGALSEAFPMYDLFRAFTSDMVRGICRRDQGIHYDNVTDAMDKLKAGAYEEVLVVPTHVIEGIEYEKVLQAVSPFCQAIPKIRISRALLGQNRGYKPVVEALMREIPSVEDDTGVILMGHGTHHSANAVYTKMNDYLQVSKKDHVYVATVEGHPDITETVALIEGKGYKKIILMPLMVVAGVHAQDDMAGDHEGSWKVILKNKGYEVTCFMKGLGELALIHQVYIHHANEAMAFNVQQPSKKETH